SVEQVEYATAWRLSIGKPPVSSSTDLCHSCYSHGPPKRLTPPNTPPQRPVAHSVTPNTPVHTHSTRVHLIHRICSDTMCSFLSVFTDTCMDDCGHAAVSPCV